MSGYTVSISLSLLFSPHLSEDLPGSSPPKSGYTVSISLSLPFSPHLSEDLPGSSPPKSEYTVSISFSLPFSLHLSEDPLAALHPCQDTLFISLFLCSYRPLCLCLKTIYRLHSWRNTATPTPLSLSLLFLLFLTLVFSVFSKLFQLMLCLSLCAWIRVASHNTNTAHTRALNIHTSTIT